MRNEDIPKELEDQAIKICKIQKIDILWLKGPFLATAVIFCRKFIICRKIGCLYTQNYISDNEC